MAATANLVVAVFCLSAAATAQDIQGDVGKFLDVFQTSCIPPSQEDYVCSAAPAECQAEDMPGDLATVAYFYNETVAACQAYPPGSVCPETSANYFESRQQCSLACVQNCQQSAPRSDGGCEEPSTGYYFDSLLGSCIDIQWDGCRTTANIFESAEECSQTCNPFGSLFVGSGDFPSLRVARQADAAAEDSDITQFCEDFKNRTRGHTPMVPQLISTIFRNVAPINDTEDNEPAPAAQSNETEVFKSPPRGGPDELPTEEGPMTIDRRPHTVATIAPTPPPLDCSRLECVRSAVGARSRLNWVTAYSRTDCVEVVIRLNCRKGWFRRPSDPDLSRLCGLIKRGIEKFWTRNITHECNGRTVTTPVRVRVHLVRRFLALNAKDVVIKVYHREPLIGNTRSHNSDLLAMTMKYSYADFPNNAAFRDEVFEKTAGHEVGHSILRAARGFGYSWTHKGTSTWAGKLLNTDRQPATGEIDLMKYYASPLRFNFLERIIATQEDVMYLIDEAKFTYCTDEGCAANDIAYPAGHPCFKGSECASGHCQFFRCVECRRDSNCPAGTHCAHQVKFWEPNRCVAGISHGSPCLRDRQCASGHCHGLRCGECEQDSHCPNGQYCSGRNLPIVQANRCVDAKEHGSLCTRDTECSSGHCHGLRCGDCKADSECPRGQYCSGRNVPVLLANRCTGGKGHGATCTRDRECANNRCHGLRCGECETDAQCAPGEYCSGRNLPILRANRCSARLGHGAVCTQDRECANGRCHGLRCGECERDSDCARGEFCSGRNLPILKANRCKAGKGHGATCTRDAECGSERCHGLRCGECELDSHCSPNQYCSGRNVPLLRANRCEARKGHGAVCISDRECANGHCHGLRCGDCERDTDCDAGEFCSGRNLPVLLANRCKAGKGHGATCTRDRECAGGHCHGLRCGDCEHDSDCRPGQFCSGRNLPLLLANRCKAGKGHGATCTRDRECADGHCHGLRCGDCEQDSDCPSSQFCSGRNLPVLQANRCKARKGHGATCTRDHECSNGHCHGLRCGECERDSDCPSSRYCSGRNLPILRANRCDPRKAHGTTCTRSRECANGHCHGLRCGDCAQDSDCQQGQFCSGRNLPIIQANRCKAGKGHGSTCTRNRECSSRQCHGLRCGECASDSNCPRGHFCSGRNLPLIKANRCKAGKSHGATCTRDRECARGLCHGLRCGDCESDTDCARGHFCSGKNLPIVQANRCSRGKENGAWCLRGRECFSGHCTVGRCSACNSDSHCPSGHICKGTPPIGTKSCKAKRCSGFCISGRECGKRCSFFRCRC